MSLPPSPEETPKNLGLKILARDSIYNLIRQGISIGLGIAISILLTRGLGKAERGVFTISIVLSELLLILFNFGMSSASVYFISRGEYSARHVFQQNMALLFWISLLTISTGSLVVMLAGSWLFPNIPTSLLLLSLALIPINLWNRSMGAIFQGLQDFRKYNLPSIVSQLIYLFLILILVWGAQLKAAGALLAYIGAAVASLILFTGLFYQMERSLPSFRFVPEKAYIARIVGYGFRAHISNLLSYLSYRLDNFILNTFSGTGEVGIYAVAVGLGERMWLPAEAISTALFPRIASLGNEQDKQKRITPLATRFILAISFPLVAGFGAISFWLVPFLYGKDFTASVYPLLSLLPGILIFNLGKILANDLAGRGRVDINLFITGVGTLINISANLLLIPRMGAVGAALSSTISYSVVTLLFISRYVRLTQSHWTDLLILRKTDLILVKRAFLNFIDNFKGQQARRTAAGK
jgi:O-antigen/teichoic acid export membrane protein